jgi:hypothetical protein
MDEAGNLDGFQSGLNQTRDERHLLLCGDLPDFQLKTISGTDFGDEHMTGKHHAHPLNLSN